MTNYVTCPTCGRQTTARKARSHQQACRKKQTVRPNTTSSRPPELAGLWDSAESEPDAVNRAAADVNRCAAAMTYELIPAVGTQCTCGKQPWLMCPERCDANLPAFYLCGFCGQVAQVGVGVVTRRLTSVPADSPELASANISGMTPAAAEPDR